MATGNNQKYGILIIGIVLSIVVGVFGFAFRDISSCYLVFNVSNPKDYLWNIGFLCGIIIFLQTIMVFLCWDSKISWFFSGVITVSLGMLVIFSYLYILLIWKKVLDNPSNILTGIGIVLAILGIVGAIFGLYITKKVEGLIEFENRVNDVSSMTVTSAELAFSILPDFTESHQIPDKSYNALKTICEHVFHPSSQILDYLKKIGNGATLRYARGLQFFAEGNYPYARDEFQEIIKEKNVKSEIKNSAYYWFGVSYRQEKKYKEAIRCFKEMFDNSKSESREMVQALYGAALTLNAVFAESDGGEYCKIYWEDKETREQIEEDISFLTERKYIIKLENHKNYNCCAQKLINEVVKEQPNNYSAILYQAKIYLSNKGKKFLENPGDETEQKIRTSLEILLKFLGRKIPESINILANYLVVEALCEVYLNDETKRKEAKNTLEHAYLTASVYKKNIFSDLKVRQISKSKFMEEIKKVDTDNKLECSFPENT